MNLQEDDFSAESLSFGNLMSQMNWKSRWIYRGSLTMPPCTRSVYWNVLETVYPVKQEVVDALSAKLLRGGLNTTEVGGNYRETQSMINWDVYFV
mmetsp:Transcript_19763/g.30490  ORF Transcript_19763/g.30490 Transcript_19763/m.30490 type:complete len:95 (+) Transcript_19763:183-467(+)